MNEKETNDGLAKLVVVSKIKERVKSRAGLSTSAEFLDKLSTIVDGILDNASSKAKEAGRKTVMARDLETNSFSS